MEIFSGLIDGIFGDENESSAKGKKKFKLQNTKGLNPDVAAEKAAKAAYVAAQRAAAAQAAANSIDVAKMLDKKAKSISKDKKLAWRTSIVDLMQVCGMDSSFKARKALAQELGYTGSIASSQSRRINSWLHKEMIRQIVANGGKVSRKLITQ